MLRPGFYMKSASQETYKIRLGRTHRETLKTTNNFKSEKLKKTCLNVCVTLFKATGDGYESLLYYTQFQAPNAEDPDRKDFVTAIT